MGVGNTSYCVFCIFLTSVRRFNMLGVKTISVLYPRVVSTLVFGVDWGIVTVIFAPTVRLV